APVEMLLDDHPETARILRLSGPIALAEEIWAKGGIGPARIEVMRRVAGPKQWLMARIKDRPAAVGFVATAGEIAMIHAVETSQDMRRQGAGRMILQGAARFALDNGAKTLALAVTRANIPANSLYQSLGMTPATAYHYRILAEASS
ncbi:MAG: GNAT family N-acetyltransferase, partial [Pikeienuella sp.]